MCLLDRLSRDCKKIVDLECMFCSITQHKAMSHSIQAHMGACNLADKVFLWSDPSKCGRGVNRVTLSWQFINQLLSSLLTHTAENKYESPWQASG
jgi:hypothetical protein